MEQISKLPAAISDEKALSAAMAEANKYGVASTVALRILAAHYNATPAQPVAVPDGWKLVPIEPTEAMILAPGALRTDGKVARIHRDIWKRMMEAVPAAPAAQGDAKDAGRWRMFEHVLRTGYVPGAGHGRRFKLVEICPMYGDEKEFGHFVEAIDAALAAKSVPSLEEIIEDKSKEIYGTIR